MRAKKTTVTIASAISMIHLFGFGGSAWGDWRTVWYERFQTNAQLQCVDGTRSMWDFFRMTMLPDR